ncbi:monofunctional biosynthetic peptidoglycan transglycosylase [Celeribacter baekdonensis]|jgi:monofunctional biosynthetic peptidoglycan transglycosylase|uniref:Biosynthetic peptidoglycan transglycosylase n=1 Tax=Celeribacter baekdonensis TaxID=875171 RepID=A0A1G7L4U6_9RHOB|nr:monofunctional biosynthetic peptidoglycan transglycosylase [Celeribacter baekdonensis]SDF44485.1 monofunctional biosynthetic peptidoglycan transglycosylase [Celeribacter baekdonensis]
MARKTQKKSTKKTTNTGPGLFRRIRRRVLRLVAVVAGLGLLWILAYSILPVPTTPYMMAEAGRQSGSVDYQWTPIERISPALARSVVAAEDANFCTHWGFDLTAIRAAIDAGGQRGASTITQQVVKNSFLWHGRNWSRKALEALITPIVELTWSKRRILEVYLNVAEFDAGVFGAEAASRHYFGVGPEALTVQQAAQLAAVLPAPKDRDAGNPGPFVRRRAAQIVDGAATISRDGRASCFDH